MRAKVIRRGMVKVFMLSLLVFVGSAAASMPVPVTITGCVTKGIVLSEETDFGSRVSKGQYEEKTIRHYGADRTAPRELHDLEKKIEEIAGTERWIKGIPEQKVTPGGS